MLYDFKCSDCQCEFQVKQPMLTNHKADCPECGKLAQRVYSRLEWVWGNSVYRPDGSLRPDSDYAPVMRG